MSNHTQGETKISVIVPSYNVQDYLSDALDSVLAQTYGNWECIIVDDGSTDGTSAVAEEYCRKDPRFKLVQEPNKGLPGARNTGLANASGEFILPLDADDRISPEYMELAMDEFSRNPETKLVYCKASLFGAQQGEWHLPEYDYERFITVNCIFCTCFYRRSDAIEIGGYDEDLRMGYEDWDFLLRLLKPQDKVVRLKKILFHYRKHQNGSAINVAVRNEKELLKQIARKNPHIYEPCKDRVIELMRKEQQLKDLTSKRETGKERIRRFFRKIFH